ncbi:MAG: hypothetical protein WCT14_15720 [Treponemataceae bacterium]
MDNKGNSQLLLNRVVSFLAGGLLVFAVMSFTVIDTAKKNTAELTKTLDASRYEAGRLLADAEAQLAGKEYVKAKESLAILFEKQPGSEESKKGTILLAKVDAAAKASDAKWVSAEFAVRTKWTAEKAAESRLESEKARVEMEKGLNDKITREWDNAKLKVRQDWEKSI